MAGLLAYAAVGAAQGFGKGLVENAVARRQEALEELREQRRQAERLQNRQWQIEDRDFAAARRGGGGGGGGGAGGEYWTEDRQQKFLTDTVKELQGEREFGRLPYEDQLAEAQRRLQVRMSSGSQATDATEDQGGDETDPETADPAEPTPAATKPDVTKPDATQKPTTPEDEGGGMAAAVAQGAQNTRTGSISFAGRVAPWAMGVMERTGLFNTAESGAEAASGMEVMTPDENTRRPRPRPMAEPMDEPMDEGEPVGLLSGIRPQPRPVGPPEVSADAPEMAFGMPDDAAPIAPRGLDPTVAQEPPTAPAAPGGPSPSDAYWPMVAPDPAFLMMAAQSGMPPGTYWRSLDEAAKAQHVRRVMANNYPEQGPQLEGPMPTQEDLDRRFVNERFRSDVAATDRMRAPDRGSARGLMPPATDRAVARPAAPTAPPAPQPDRDLIARPKSKADYDALPSGTTFIDPEGNVRIKP
jgi:MoCo/4Fe-4S cofactor protein with predicted Tat translocation signal